ncbi:MAG: hypothetical protein HN353_00455 [Bdellovibrionales bacterium]|jgi:hypothetical protein|nr:hypothetical protein [Bdellovibrionales bacterium]MBT3525671.1 hypothetical protein [Bdellovibrionales bacterium]MBT7768113.1 hypothetical protein [Bdellovibrionales bacterium]
MRRLSLLMVTILLASLLSLHVWGQSESFQFNMVGEVEFSILAEQISDDLRGAPVEISCIRHSYDLLDYGMDSRNYNLYIIRFELDSKHMVKCELMELLTQHSLLLTRCESSTAQVDPNNFISFDDLGSSTWKGVSKGEGNIQKSLLVDHY